MLETTLQLLLTNKMSELTTVDVKRSNLHRLLNKIFHQEITLNCNISVEGCFDIIYSVNPKRPSICNTRT